MTNSPNYSEDALFARESLFRQKLSQLRNTGEIRRATESSIQAGIREMKQGLYLKNVGSTFEQGDPRQLEKLALLDSLTELYNHDTITRMLKDEVKRSQRYKKETSILVIGLDFLTYTENQGGPIAADSVLKAAAQLVMDTIRDVDLPGRYNRDHFLLVCPETPLVGALCLAERLCRLTCTERFSKMEESWKITFSIGLAALFEPAENDEQLLHLAFQALSLVEQSGGNNYGAVKTKSAKMCRQ